MDTNLTPKSPPAGARRHSFVSRFALIVGLLAYALAFQGSRGLWEPDEGRYTAVALQMLQSGNFINPALNHETPHYTKPPLTYWAIAGGIALLGKNEWGARLANALAFAATIYLVWLLARKIVPKQSWLPPLVYALSPFPVIAANIVTTDTPLAFFETVAAYGFVSWWLKRDQPRWYRSVALMWLGFSLAFLTKGFPGLLPLPVMLGFVVLAAGWRAALPLLHAAGLLIFLTLGLSWYFMVIATRPELLRYFLYDEFVLRVSSDTFKRNSEWYGAFKIYLPVLLGGALPWVLVAFLKFPAVCQRMFSRDWWCEKLQREPLLAFLLMWILFPLAVFWLSRSRMYLYLLPLFVPIALLLGRMLADSPWFHRLKPGLLAALMLVLLLACKFISLQIHNRKDDRPFAQAIAAGVSSSPQKIIFLDTSPRWGLSLYLSGEVEQATLNPVPDGLARPQTLAEKMAAHEAGSLLVFDKEQAASVKAELNRLGCSTRVLFEYGDDLFVAPYADLQRR